jgi:hypothetical protein
MKSLQSGQKVANKIRLNQAIQGILTFLKQLSLGGKGLDIVFIKIVQHVMSRKANLIKMFPFFLFFSHKIDTIYRKVGLGSSFSKKVNNLVQLISKNNLIHVLYVQIGRFLLLGQHAERSLVFVEDLHMHFLFVHDVLNCRN